MINEGKYIVMLASNNYTSFLYKKLRRRCKVEYISAPAGIAKSCKKVLRFNESDINIVIEEIIRNKLKIIGMYKLVIKNQRVTYVLIK